MTYIQHYDSPLGGILLAADEFGLTGLWFEGRNTLPGICPTNALSRKRPFSQRPDLAGYLFHR